MIIRTLKQLDIVTTAEMLLPQAVGHKSRKLYLLEICKKGVCLYLSRKCSVKNIALSEPKNVETFKWNYIVVQTLMISVNNDFYLALWHLLWTLCFDVVLLSSRTGWDNYKNLMCKHWIMKNNSEHHQIALAVMKIKPPIPFTITKQCNVFSDHFKHTFVLERVKDPD